jgi:penicillin-binding protein 1A
VFANGGYKIEPYFIERITDNSGNVLFEADPLVVCRDCSTPTVAAETGPAIATQTMLPAAAPASSPAAVTTLPDETKSEKRLAPRVVSAENIWIMNSMTRDVIKRGTATRALELKRQDLAGKTGTTNDQHDAWFFGYNPSVVAVSWVGFDDFRGLGSNEVGGRAALPMWIEYMRVVLADQPEIIHEQPPGVVTARIDPATGKLASADNPDAIFEVFLSKHTPVAPAEDTTVNNKRADERIPEQLF